MRVAAELGWLPKIGQAQLVFSKRPGDPWKNLLAVASSDIRITASDRPVRAPVDDRGLVQGRDHNPFAFTSWLAGGGIKGGTSYGESDEFGYKTRLRSGALLRFACDRPAFIGCRPYEANALPQWNRTATDRCSWSCHPLHTELMDGRSIQHFSSIR